MTDTNTVTLTIDDREFSVPEGMLLVDATKMHGTDVPVFCHHPKLDPVGMCRMCLVELAAPRPNRETGEMELAWFPTLQTACTTRVVDGMVVKTRSAQVKEAQDDVLEFLLSSHPLDCPVCDKGGECPLQDLTMTHGPGTSRFNFDEKMKLAKHVPLGELIYLDRERCIQCARCTRFSDEIADDHVIAFHERGRNLQIVSVSEPGFDSYFSGNTSDICPVGALTTADFRFGARPWELTQVATVCSHCPVGCNMTFSTRQDARSGGEVVIKRVMPRQNEQVNEIWICDKGRFGHRFADSPQRLTRPLMREGGELVEKDWDEVISTIVAKLKSAGSDVGGLAGPRLSNEDLYLFQKLIRGQGGNHLDIYGSRMDSGDLVAQVGVGQGTNLSDLGQGDAILVVASDLEEEAPIWWLRVKQAAERGATLILVNGRITKLDRYTNRSLQPAYGQEAATVLALSSALIKKAQPGRDVDGMDDLNAQLSSYQADKAQKDAASVLAEANNVVALVGGEGLMRAASRALAQAVANLLIVSGHVGRPNNGLMLVTSGANVQGALDMGLSPDWGAGYQPLEGQGMDYTAMLAAVSDNTLKTLYIAAADPAADDPNAVDALNAAQFVIVQDMFLTETARLADVVLPVQSVAEREGTYTNGERRVQRFYPAIVAVGQSKADWEIIAELAEHLGHGEQPPSPAAIMLEISQNVPLYNGITYQQLAEVVDQWPDVGGTDLYYGGTSFKNTGGLGIQLPSIADYPEEQLYVKWAEPQSAPAPSGDELLVVPTNLLYNREPAFAQSTLMHQRIPAPFVTLHPDDAARLNIAAGDEVTVQINGYGVQATAHINGQGEEGSAPQGVALLPAALHASHAASPSGAVAATLTRVAG